MGSPLSSAGAAFPAVPNKNCYANNLVQDQSGKTSYNFQDLAKKTRNIASDKRGLNSSTNQNQQNIKRGWLSQTIEKFISNPLIKDDIRVATNIFAFGVNIYSSLVNAFSKSSKRKESATKLGAGATKVNLGLNNLIGALIQLCTKRNSITGIACLIGSYIAMTLKQSAIYLAKGLNEGINLASFGLFYYEQKTLNKLGKDSFDTFGEHLKTVIPNLKAACKELSPKIDKGNDFFIRMGNYLSTVFKTISGKESGFLTIFNGFGMTLGASIGLFTPFKNFGKFVRNITGMLQDITRLKDGFSSHNFRAGACYLLGSIFEFVRMKYTKHENVLVPLVFAWNGLGGYFHRLAHDEGENNSAKPIEETSPVGNIHQMPIATQDERLLEEQQNEDLEFDGIEKDGNLIQMPLPPQEDEREYRMAG